MPPTEKRGRIQTSTITVAVFQEPTAQDVRIRDEDVEWHATRGSGPGGQNRNKTATCVMMTHKPTGITVRCESERSQSQNRETAMRILRTKVKAEQDKRDVEALNSDRSLQVGSGMRGDKRRTYREKDDCVSDHITGKKATLKRIMKGELELLA